MKVRLSTDICPIITPDTYNTGFQYEIEDSMWEEFKYLMLNVAKSYIERAIFATDFKSAEISNYKFRSPQFYNYSTDWIEFDIEFDDSLLDVITNKVNEDFFKYVKKYDSHPGFISRYPTERKYFYEAINNRNDKLPLAISLFIMWQLDKGEKLEKRQNEYLDDVTEFATENGYFIE